MKSREDKITINDFIKSETEKIYNEIVKVRREIHMCPELGDEEHETSKKIKKYVADLGLKYKEVAGTGVLVTIENGEGPVVATRADIDALPILGAGAFMIPWIVVSLIVKDFKMAVALLILYVIVTAVRQLLEPKLYSQNIGVHPLITLLSMYTGLKLAGFIGIIMGPAVVIILKNVFHEELERGFFKGMFGKKEKIDTETENNNTNT